MIITRAINYIAMPIKQISNQSIFFSSFRDSTYTEGEGMSDSRDGANGNIETIFDGINR